MLSMAALLAPLLSMAIFSGTSFSSSMHSLRHYVPFLTMSCDASASAETPGSLLSASLPRRARSPDIVFLVLPTVEKVQPFCWQRVNELPEHCGVASASPQMSSEISKIRHSMIGDEAS